jgi:fatty-acyl-CoA synthase
MIDARRRATRNAIGDALRRAVSKNRTKPALVWKDRDWTFEQLEAASIAVAEAFSARGLRKGDRIVAFGRNSDAYLLLWLGCVQAGFIHVPANYGLTPGELRYIVEQSGARVLIADQALMDSVETARDLPTLELVGHFEGGGDIDVISAARQPVSQPRPDWDVRGEDPSQIIYTSGTTGLPKGGLITHAALLSEYMSSIQACEYEVSDRALFALPLYHAGQLHNFTMPQLLMGSSTVLIEQPKPDLVFAMVETHRINSFFAPPTSWINLLRHQDIDRYDLSSLHKLYYGASIMPAPILAELRTRFPGVRTYNCYGQSEVGPLATILRPEEHDDRPTSAGRPVLNVETRVVDDEMNDMPPGEVGEIVHRSPQIIDCYWDKPEETAEAFAGGWFHSGDLGYFDEEGFLYIVDRKKDVIKSGGIVVASREVEDALYQHDAVHEVAVVGLPHPKWIEAVTAIVVCREGQSTTEEDLLMHARDRLAYYKIPKRVIFAEALPRNASGKILKRELRRIHGGTESAFVTAATSFPEA